MTRETNGGLASSQLIYFYKDDIVKRSLELSKRGISSLSIPLGKLDCSHGMLKTILTLDKYTVHVSESNFNVSWK